MIRVVFFTGANAGRQSNLSAAATYLEGFINGTTLTGVFFNPTDTTDTYISDLPIAANTIVIYAGGSSLLDSGALAVGGPGGWGGSGSAGFIGNLSTRGTAFKMPWGGSISFNISQPWYFDNNINTVESFADQFDFFTTAVHELMHLIGIGTSDEWTNRISGSNFIGTNSEAVFGGLVPLSSDLAHWNDFTVSPLTDGTGLGLSVMGPFLNQNMRSYMTNLDVAGLQDIGYSTAIPEPSTYAGIFGCIALCIVTFRRLRK